MAMSDDEFVLEVHPAMQGIISRLALLEPELLIGVRAGHPWGAGRWFGVKGPGYVLECGTTGSALVLRRNHQRVELELVCSESRTGGVSILVWVKPTELGVRVGDREKSLSTPMTPPPNGMLAWARRNALLPIVSYPTPVAVFDEVVHQLELLAKRIVNTNGMEGFWDVTYEGNRITRREPKREPDIHTHFRLLLCDLEIQRGLEVVPEYEIGSGQLDFLIVGRTDDHKVVRVCVEFKRAHSPIWCAG